MPTIRIPFESKMVYAYQAAIGEIDMRLVSMWNLKEFLFIQKRRQSPYILPEITVMEFFYLQLRLICEALAFSFLIAHNELKRTQRMHNQWSADTIVKALSSIHPGFYPTPGRQVKAPDGTVTGFEVLTSGYLTKDELLGLYAECHQHIRHLSLKTILNRKAGEIDFLRITDWYNKILALVDTHRINYFDGGQLWVTMRRAGHAGPVVEHFRKPPVPDVRPNRK